MTTERKFSTELAARRFIRECAEAGLRTSVWNRSCCEYIVTVTR